MARSYQALGESQHSQKWMVRAWDQLLSDHKSEDKRVKKIDHPNVIQMLKRDFSSQQLKLDGTKLKDTLVGRSRFVYELADVPNLGGEQWQNIFLLEAQARRIHLERQQISIAPSARLNCIFPKDAIRPVYIIIYGVWANVVTIGYVCSSGNVHACYKLSNEQLRSMRKRDILPRGEQPEEGVNLDELLGSGFPLGLREPGDD
jgi:hypothetical protein